LPPPEIVDSTPAPKVAPASADASWAVINWPGSMAVGTPVARLGRLIGSEVAVGAAVATGAGVVVGATVAAGVSVALDELQAAATNPTSATAAARLIQRAGARRARPKSVESLAGVPVDGFPDRLLELGAGSTPLALDSSAFFGPLSTCGRHKRVWRIGRPSGWANSDRGAGGTGSRSAPSRYQRSA
jgi:hypothetical protein